MGENVDDDSEENSGMNSSTESRRMCSDPPRTISAGSLTSPAAVAYFGHRLRNGAHDLLLELVGEYGLRWTDIPWRPWLDTGCGGGGGDDGKGCGGTTTEAEAEKAWGSPVGLFKLGMVERETTCRTNLTSGTNDATESDGGGGVIGGTVGGTVGENKTNDRHDDEDETQGRAHSPSVSRS